MDVVKLDMTTINRQVMRRRLLCLIELSLFSELLIADMPTHIIPENIQ